MAKDDIIWSIQQALNKSYAYDEISYRRQEAISYCEKHIPEAQGKNIWHAILDDAIRLREENASLKHNQKRM